MSVGMRDSRAATAEVARIGTYRVVLTGGTIFVEWTSSSGTGHGFRPVLRYVSNQKQSVLDVPFACTSKTLFRILEDFDRATREGDFDRVILTILD